jgi:two-component system OmpR family sensor kinase
MIRRWFSQMGVRARLLFAILVTVAVALITMTVAFNVFLDALLTSDIDDRLQTMANDTSRTISIVGGAVSLPKPSGDIKQLGSQVWVFVGGKTFSSPDVNSAIDEAARTLRDTVQAEGHARYANVPDQEVRLFGVPLWDNEKTAQIGTIITGMDMASYGRTQRTALVGTIAFTAVLLIMVGFVGRWALNAAFRPVSQMTLEAEAWSTSDLDKRFEMGDPHDEVTHLARTLDAMLDRLAASLRRERRFSAEVSHQLRTPVAKIKAEAELALRRERDPVYYQEALTSVLHSADQMARTVETLLAAAKEEGTLARGRADACKVLDDVTGGVKVMAGERGLELKTECGSHDVWVGVGGDIAAQIIQPVVENACRFGAGKVTVAVVREGKQVHFIVDDDGPGVTDEEKDRIFEPGVRGSAALGGPQASRGAGLGLSLARRLARAAAGDVVVEPRGEGARFVVRLPSG